MLAFLTDPDGGARQDAASFLAYQAETADLDTDLLLAALQSETDKRNRGSLCIALGRAGDPRAVEPLVACLEDTDRALNSRAARALATLGWKPANETQRIRYAMFGGGTEEDRNSIPKAEKVENVDRVEGPFHLNVPIQSPLTVGAEEYSEVVMLHTAEFRESGDELKAILQMNTYSWPKAKWSILVELLDGNDNVLGKGQSAVQTPGYIISIQSIGMISPHEIPIEGVEDLSAVKRFTISLERTVIGKASYQWFGYPTGEDSASEYCLTDRMALPEAREKAYDLDAILADIENEEENAWLAKTFGDADCLLVGLTDIAEEGAWIWDSGSTSDYRNWARDEPNNANDNEDVVVMHSNGEWNDLSPETKGRWVLKREIHSNSE